MNEKLFHHNEASMRRARSVAHSVGRGLKKILFFSPAEEVVSPRKHLALSLGVDALSIAHGSRLFNRIRVAGFKAYRFEEGQFPSPEAVASIAALYCSEVSWSHRQVTFCVPKAWSVVQTTELPAAAKENLPDVIGFELDRITPFSADDAYYDCRIINEENGRITVTILALRRDILDPYLRALAEKGLTVTRVDTALSAATIFLAYAWREENLIYLDIGVRGYEGGLLRSGIIVAACAGDFDGEGVDDSRLFDVAEDCHPWVERLKRWEILPRLMVHPHNGVSCGSLEAHLQIPLETVRGGDLDVPGFKGETKEVPHDAVGGLLASLWLKSKAMNVLSGGRVGRSKPTWTLSIILAVVLAAIGVLVLLLPLYHGDQRIAVIDQEIATRKDAVKRVEALRKETVALQSEVGAITNFKQGKASPLNILKELTVLLPKSVWLTRVRITDSSVEIEGYAASATDILSRLEASPLFTKVEFASPTIRDVRLNADRFVIRMENEGIKREEPKAAKNGKKT